MSDAFHCDLKVLVANMFMGHSNIDIKDLVPVTAFVTGIIRMTPDLTYDDELQKVIFKRIVEVLEKLEDVYSELYFRMISDLETIAKVVVKFDHECDASVLEIFHHFLKNIRSNHPENVAMSMETIMILGLLKSENISSELLSCLLDSVKKDSKVARNLAERVICKCARKLKPYLKEVAKSSCSHEYGKVANICLENIDTLDHIKINISRENLVKDGGDDIHTPSLPVVNRLPDKHTQQDRSGADDTPDAERNWFYWFSKNTGSNSIYYVGAMIFYWALLFLCAPISVAKNELVLITYYILAVSCVCCYLIALGIHRFQSPSAPAKYIMLLSSVVLGCTFVFYILIANMIDGFTSKPGG